MAFDYSTCYSWPLPKGQYKNINNASISIRKVNDTSYMPGYAYNRVKISDTAKFLKKSLQQVNKTTVFGKFFKLMSLTNSP